MKPYHQLLLLLVLALAGALLFHVLAEDPGYVLVSFDGWAIETTLVVAVVAVVAVATTVSLIYRVLRWPLAWLGRNKRRLARERLAGGLVALRQGHWARAEKLLGRAASEPTQRTAAALAAAEAAFQRMQPARAERWLLQAAEAGGEELVAIVNAERLIANRQFATACELLETRSRGGAMAPLALELRLQALVANGRAGEALELIPQLRASKVREGDPLQATETRIAVAALQQAASASELDRSWEQLTRNLRQQPQVAEAYALRGLFFGSGEEGSAALERALAKQWNEAAAQSWGRLAHASTRAAIRVAESWLSSRQESPGVLLTLGQLCRREALWGKAESYLQRAIAAGAEAPAWETLAEVFAEQGDEALARQALGNALRRQRGEPASTLHRRERLAEDAANAAVEERTSMGLPRLTAT